MNGKSKNISVLTTLSDIAYSLVPLWAASVIFLAIINLTTLFRIVPESFKLKDVPRQPSIGNVISPLLNKLDTIPHINTITTFVFWCLAGIIMYLVGIIIYSLYFTARNDLDESSNYLLPLTVKRSSIRKTITINWLIFISLLFITFTILASIFIIWIPVCRELFISGIRHPGSASAWITSIASSLTLAVIVYAFLFLFRLDRKIYNQL